MLTVINHENIKGVGISEVKSQIILTHTSRNINNYLQSIKFRYNGNYDRIPHYVIARDGVVHKLMDDKEYSNNRLKNQINKKSIFISLENLGWLEKEPLKEHYINWIGDIYKGSVFKKKWRDYYFWQPYTEEQINSLYLLIKDLTIKFNIEFNIVGHNTLINGVENYGGIVSRSNFNNRYTEVNPSFDFELFLKKIENEQIR